MLVFSVIATGTSLPPVDVVRAHAQLRLEGWVPWSRRRLALGTRYGLRLLARQEGGQPHLPGARGHGAVDAEPAAFLLKPVGHGLEPLRRPLGELLVPHPRPWRPRA